MADNDLGTTYLGGHERRMGQELDRWLTETLRPPQAVAPSRQQYEAMVDELAPQYGLDPTMVKAMIQAESNWQPNAVSPKGAKGIAQFMDATAKRYGVQDPFDPAQAIPGMLRYLRDLTNEFGDPTLVVAAYNAGEGAVRQYKAVPPYAETMNYVRKVFGGPEGQAYISKGAGAGPLTSPQETKELREGVRTAQMAPPAPPPPSLLDTTLPGLADEGMIEMSQEARQARLTTSKGEGLGPTEFPPARRFNPLLPGGSLEPSLEEPTAQRIPLRVMEGTLGTMASILALPKTGFRLLGVPEREAAQAFPVLEALSTELREMKGAFDPTGTEENIVDRFAETVGQQLVFFGSGALVTGGARAIAGVAPQIARTLGATTAAVQEAGLEAEQTLTALTPIVGEQEAARRANTVFWRNAAVLAVTNKLGVFGEAHAGLLKLSTAAAMEGFQEVVQYDVGRREFWVPERHPLAPHLRALGWRTEAGRVSQPFDIADATEAGVLGAVIGGAGGVVRNQLGQQVLPKENEKRIRQGLERIAGATGELRQQAQPTQVPQEQAQLTTIRERVAGMEDSQVRDGEGRLIRMYHGTATAFAQFDVGKSDPQGLYGPGLYFTDNPDIASGYTTKGPGAARGWTSTDTPAPVPEQANVRPVYLDIKQPFDLRAPVSRQEATRLLEATKGASLESATNMLSGYPRGMTGDELYQLLSLRGFGGDKVATNQFLQAQGYDGIVHTGGAVTGGAAHQVYIAFSPEQVIPAFELEAHPWFKSVLAYADRPIEEEATVAGVGMGGGLLSGQGGAINPFRRMNLFPAKPSPPPKPGAPTLGTGATGLERGNFRDEHGRWRLPLQQMPSQELELQDFIRQQGGIRLAGEELQGELAALISRKETGIGGLQNASGMTLQQIAEKAQELGFTPSADKTAFLDALDRSVTQGHNVYSTYSTGTVPVIHNPELVNLYREVVELADTIEARTAEQRRGVRPRAQVHEEARAFIEGGGWSIEDVRDLMPGTVLDDTTASALVQLLGQIAADAGTIAQTYLTKLEQGGTKPGEGSQEERAWLAAFGGVASTHPQRAGAMAEAGRSLGILNDPLSSTNQFLNAVGSLVAKARDMNSKRLAETYLDLMQLAGGKKAVQFAQQALTPGLGDMLMELRYQFMLSNPKTWLVNEVSNATTAAWALPVRFMSGLISQTVGSGEVSMLETAAYAYGLQHGMTQAWRLSMDAFRTEQPQFGLAIPGIGEPIGAQKAGQSLAGPALTVQNLQANGYPIDPDSPFGRFADFWFEWIGAATGGRTGTKIMQSRDEFYKMFNYMGEMGALAYRQAVAQHTLDPEQSFGENMARVLSEPLPEEMHRAAANHALIQTFQNELQPGGLGAAVAKFQQLHVNVPGFGDFPIGRMIVPFLHVATNIPRYALENSPLGFFFKSVRDDLAAGGAAADLALGKMMMGSLTAATFALMASSGLITGRGPEDKDLRAGMERAGWKPYSLFVPWIGKNGGYVSLRAFDPNIGQHAGIMADNIEVYGEQRLEWYEKAILGPLFAITSGIGSRGYMRSMSEFFNVFSPRSMRELEGESAYEGLRGAIRGQVSTFAPAIWSVAQKAVDPATKTAWSMADGFRQKVPGWTPLPEGVTAAALPNYRNKWGDKRLVGFGWMPEWLNWVEGFTQAVSPLQISVLLNNPLDRELTQKQIRLVMPTHTLGIPGVPGDVSGEGAAEAFAAAEAANPYAVKPIALTPHQYEKRVVLGAANREGIAELGLSYDPKAMDTVRSKVRDIVGQRVPADVGTELYDTLLWATTTPQYQGETPGPQGGQEEMLRRIDAAYRKGGDEQLLAQDTELRQRYLTGKALRELQQTPMEQRERMRGRQERTMEREEQRLRVGAPR